VYGSAAAGQARSLEVSERSAISDSRRRGTAEH